LGPYEKKTTAANRERFTKKKKRPDRIQLLNNGAIDFESLDVLNRDPIMKEYPTP
jgi:predicted GIY-YIG superfamily endonuclease